MGSAAFFEEVELAIFMIAAWYDPNIESGAEKVEGAVGEPEDIAAAICILTTDEARFITGTTPVVDGGLLDIL